MKNFKLIMAIYAILFSASVFVFIQEVKNMDESSKSETNQTVILTDNDYLSMSATLIYLRETKQLKDFTIDLHRLIQIQDSLNLDKYKK